MITNLNMSVSFLAKTSPVVFLFELYIEKLTLSIGFAFCIAFLISGAKKLEVFFSKNQTTANAIKVATISGGIATFKFLSLL